MKSSFKKLLLLTAFLLVGKCMWADYYSLNCTSSDNITLYATNDGNKFKLSKLALKKYDGISSITVSNNATLTITFQTSKAVKVKGNIKVEKGTLNMKLGDDYSSTTTLERESGFKGILIYVNPTGNCNLNIQGKSSKRFCISGGASMTVTCDKTADASTWKATISDANYNSCYGLIYLNGGTTNLEYVTLTNSYVGTLEYGGYNYYCNGGGINASLNDNYNIGLTMNNCTIEKCYARGNGSALYATSAATCKKMATVKMYNCTIQNCFNGTEKSVNGGTIRCPGSAIAKLTMDGCTVKNNVSKSMGGGVTWITGLVNNAYSIINCTIQDNVCATAGAGLRLSGSGEVKSCTIKGNYTKTNGGGIHYGTYASTEEASSSFENVKFVNGSLNLDASTSITNNTAEGNGGGVYFGVSPINIKISENNFYTVFQNTNNGQYEVSLKIDGSTITGNKADNGGGFYINRTTDIYIANSSFIRGTLSDNQAVTDNNSTGTTGFGGGTAIYTSNSSTYYGNFPYEPSQMQIKFGNTDDGNDQLKVQKNKAGQRGGACYVSGTSTVNIYSGTFGGSGDTYANKVTDGNGGAFFVNNGNVTIKNAEVSYNKASNGLGGGVYVSGGSITIDGASILRNGANSGAGFYAQGGSVTIQNNSKVNNNTASENGGGGYGSAGVSVEQSELSSNAAKNGGGFYCSSGTSIIKGSTLSDNTATGDGAGVYVGGGILEVKNIGKAVTSVVSRNKTETGKGGGFFVNGGKTTIDGGNITHNEANYGGGFYCVDGDMSVKGGTIGNNISKEDGGGIYVKGTFSMEGGSISDNKAVNGGGIYAEEGSVATISSGTITDNKATEGGNGGGIYIKNGATINLYKSAVISSNSTDSNGKGGGIYMNGTMNVAGDAITVMNNTDAAGKANNVYLPEYENVINIVDYEDQESGNIYHGVSEAVNIGISVPSVPTPVIGSEHEAYLSDIASKLINQDTEHPSQLKDDLNKYQAIFSDGPTPYNLNQLFFIGTWQAGCVEESEIFDDDEYEGIDPIEINNEEQMAKFMCYVNGLNGFSPHPNANGKVTKDLNMQSYLWLPMGTVDIDNTYLYGEPLPYSGTFDGNGHVISGLITVGLLGYSNFGLFGNTNNATIRNVFVTDCDFRASNSESITHMGCIIGTMMGGELAYSEGAGKLINNANANSITGGLVGYVVPGFDGTNVFYPSIHSSMAMADMTGFTMGGLIGEMDYYDAGAFGVQCDYKVENCFANPKFTTTSADHYIGGLVGIDNGGVIGYSYCRLDRGQTFPSGAKIGRYIGLLPYRSNTGLNTCFCPKTNGGIENYFGEREQYSWASNFFTYEDVLDPSSYTYTEGQDTYVVSIESGERPDPNDWRLLAQLQACSNFLNQGLETPKYATWKRTGAGHFTAVGGNINSDYPIHDFSNVDGLVPHYRCLGSKDGVVLDFAENLSIMIYRYNGYENGGTINLFESVNINDEGTSSCVTDHDVLVHIDEGVKLIQPEGSAINAVVHQTLKTYADAGNERWHSYSSPLKDQKIGFNYGTMTQVEYNYEPNPCNVSLAADESMSFFPTDSPINSLDLYSFYEPHYHWINLKRNTLSHWHMDNLGWNIPYANETILIPGKGYLVSLDIERQLSEYGILNCGSMTSSDRTEDKITASAVGGDGPNLKGYNLLGNPYLAYLDFDKFATQNTNLWSGSGELDGSYAIYDPQIDAYVSYEAGSEQPSIGSSFPGKWLAPHQGFFIVKSGTAEQVKFIETGTNGMCSLDGDNGEMRRENPAYVLLNLTARDADGHADIMAVEFGRPSQGGSHKVKNLCTGDFLLYSHYEGRDYANLFLDKDVESLPIYFECTEGGTYTLTWNTANGTFSYLRLIDNLTGMDIDMLVSDGYTFQANSNDYTSRFKLKFAYTGVEESSETVNKQFAFVSNGNLIVNGMGVLEIIDMSGRVLNVTRLTDSQNMVTLPDVACGIYVLKLTDCTCPKVQKIVIR